MTGDQYQAGSGGETITWPDDPAAVSLSVSGLLT
ncbi:hypothetical protein UNH65_08390 [Chitinophaga sp. 180180018-2]|nr:hypothetical protein [Chitinophaga sp. 212800010-3]